MASNSAGTVGYSAYDALGSVIGTATSADAPIKQATYSELLKQIRERIAREHTAELNYVLTDSNARSLLIPIIQNYILDYINTSKDIDINVSVYTEKIYDDIAGFGILTPYLTDPSVEEININSWNSIEVVYATHHQHIDNTFSSPQECVDIIRKMVRLGGTYIDSSQPKVDSFIGDGTRISATLPPINTDKTGTTASIRKQTHRDITREKYIAAGSATPELFDFLRLAVYNSLSFGFAGSPGAGKTTLMTCLLRDFLHNAPVENKRIITIEESREIDLVETEDANPNGGIPRLIYPVLAWNTRVIGDTNITARDLIRHTLRYNPRIVVPAEMRGDEAIEAVEAGLTGVQIMSSFHAWGAQDGYQRILSMCQMGKSTASETTLLSQIIRAFPLMVYIRKDDDGVRRIQEVFEATGVEDGAVVGNKIFEFIRTEVIENTEGKIIEIKGRYIQVDSISDSLRYKLIQGGAKKEFVDKYYFESGQNPYCPEIYRSLSAVVETKIEPENGGGAASLIPHGKPWGLHDNPE